MILGALRDHINENGAIALLYVTLIVATAVIWLCHRWWQRRRRR